MIKRLFIFAFIAAIATLGYLKRDDLATILFKRHRTTNNQEVKLLLPQDMTIEEVANLLIEKKVLEKSRYFLSVMEDLGLKDSTVDAGKYIILSGTKVDDLAEGFVRGVNGHGVDEVMVKVIFNRCKTIEDIGTNISKCISADAASLVKTIRSTETLKKYKFTEAQIPAMFIPDEYEMYYDTSAEEFVEFMSIQFKNFWTQERMEQLKKIGLSYPSQASTLASIVYSEQGRVAEEWPIIARLYLNRLKKGMKLQSDPTFKFCWGDKLNGVQRLKGKHRDIDCAYNTYKNEGLPPGPIFITPRKVIEAVLQPDSNDYLFMCAKPDYSYTHDFTSSGVQHMKNAKTYQTWLSSQGKK